jgi:polysaccharide deacetylase family protein (PEP-CTERM system associated)
LTHGRPRLVLTIDLEDWHQIVHRGLGLSDWDRPHEAFERQVATLLALLDELGLRATFFVLGMCASHYPDAVREIASRGHELGSHGYAHVPAHRQGRDEFRRDVEQSIALVEELGGARPRGYRAPAFSITRAAAWAYDVLAELGFAYDSSQYDTPRIPDRLHNIPAEPYHLVVGGGMRLIEFPVAVGRWRGRRLPVGGGSYWRVLPQRILFDALRGAAGPNAAPVLYFHPYEFDPEPLRTTSRSARGRAQVVYWNARRGRIAELLRAASGEFELLSHERYLATSGEPGGARTKTLSRDGELV